MTLNEKLKKIKTTKGGYLVKNLANNTNPSNTYIIVGLVKDDLFGNENFRDGYVSAQWNLKGYPIKANKGREDMKLDIDAQDNI